MPGRKGVSFALLVTGVACGTSDAAKTVDGGALDGGSKVDGGGDLSGTSCEYLCSGIACNTRCEGEVLYRCPESGKWVLEADCAAQGQRCVLDSDGMGSGSHRCEAQADAGADAGGDLCVPEPSTGSSCSYVATPGTATITAITAAGAEENNCPTNPVRVSFSFAPDDVRREVCFVGGGSGSKVGTITVGDGKNPPRACLDAMSLSVGSSVRAVRKDIQKGTCTPVIYELDSALVEACTDACK